MCQRRELSVQISEWEDGWRDVMVVVRRKRKGMGQGLIQGVDAGGCGTSVVAQHICCSNLFTPAKFQPAGLGYAEAATATTSAGYITGNLQFPPQLR
jgi:hypothetical protein